MKPSEVLRRAVPALWVPTTLAEASAGCPKAQFVAICAAITETSPRRSRRSRSERAAIVKVFGRIAELLGENIYYAGWIWRHHPDLPEACASLAEIARQMQRGRLAWMLWLIADYESKGE